jgi:hypothetical protein
MGDDEVMRNPDGSTIFWILTPRSLSWDVMPKRAAA